MLLGYMGPTPWCDARSASIRNCTFTNVGMMQMPSKCAEGVTFGLRHFEHYILHFAHLMSFVCLTIASKDVFPARWVLVIHWPRTRSLRSPWTVGSNGVVEMVRWCKRRLQPQGDWEKVFNLEIAHTTAMNDV